MVILQEVRLKSLKYTPNVPKKNPLRFQKYNEIESTNDIKAININADVDLSVFLIHINNVITLPIVPKTETRTLKIPTTVYKTLYKLFVSIWNLKNKC